MANEDITLAHRKYVNKGVLLDKVALYVLKNGVYEIHLK